jgi:mycothiol synthase
VVRTGADIRATYGAPAADDAGMDLPDGLTTRPLRHSDAQAVFELMAAVEKATTGEVAIEVGDILADWQRPSHDLASQSVGVLEGGTLVGYAEVIGHDRGDAAVHPTHEGRGIGTALARWMQDRARSRGSRVVGMPVPVGSPGDRLLEALGYRVRWHSWVLRLPEGARIPDRELPEGYAVRAATPEEYPDVWRVIEDAFLEWSERDREPYEDFAASVVGRPGFEPWHLRVVTDPEGAVVGVAFLVMADDTCYVDRLAVDRAHRHRGLAQVLLVDAFARGREHGATRSELSTDSRTGALALYEKVGMVVTSEWVNRAVDL